MTEHSDGTVPNIEHEDGQHQQPQPVQEPTAASATRPAQPSTSSSAGPAGLASGGLPARPGGLPGLPPRGLAATLPPRPQATAAAAQPAPSGAAGTPATPAAPTSSAAGNATPTAAASAMPKLPARQPVGLPGLPARPTPAASSSQASPTPAASAPAPTAAPSAAPTPAAATATPSPPTTTASRPTLPPRPAGLGGAALPKPASTATPPPTTAAAPATAAAATASTPAGGSTAAGAPAASGTAAGPSSSAGAGPALPARPPAGLGRGGLAPRPAGAPSASSQPAPSASAAATGQASASPAAAVPQPAAGAAAAAASTATAVTTPAAAQPAGEPTAVDAAEPARIRNVQAATQLTRVKLIRAAGRLGLRYDADLVLQFMGVIGRVETMHGATLYRTPGRALPLVQMAQATARELDSRQAADSRLDIKVKVLLLGFSGVGKSELINALLERPAAYTSAHQGATRRVRVVKGMVHGIQLELIDTPGLQPSSSASAYNKDLLRTIKAAYRWHKPNYVFWVDRVDSGRPALAELAMLTQINAALGNKVWKETMVVLTHAHACRAAQGSNYDTYTKQRRNIVSQIIRQAAGDAQVRNPMFLVDCHPSCPKNSFGQPIVMEGITQVPWKQGLMMQLVGYRLYEDVLAMFKSAAKTKAGPSPAKQADMFKQLMRPRLPPLMYWVEQACEGLLEPPGWGAHVDPMDQDTEDLEAEEYEHGYYKEVYRLAVKGNPEAQKEYAMMLDKQARTRKTYRDAFQDEDITQLATAGYEGYVAEGLDLGPTFDPVDWTNHRYVYAVPEADVHLMPTLDYYGFEHEDAINGIVAEYDAQLGARHGWGGMPMHMHVALEKDKTSLCVQGEMQLSLVHSVPPFGRRHITQVNAACEVLRPNIKDVLYQLDVHTFKDGFLRPQDHAGVGVIMARLGEGGKLNKGPQGMGVRLQDKLRVGPCKVHAAVAKMQADSAQGGRDTAWGGRAFVMCDFLPGVGTMLDFYQQRTKETDAFTIGGWAAAFNYNFGLLGGACGLDVDYVPCQESLHLDLKVYHRSSYKLAWVLLLPAWNLARAWWSQLRQWQQGEGEDMEEEGEEEGQEDDGDGLTPEQRQQLQMQQLMRLMAAQGGRA